MAYQRRTRTNEKVNPNVKLGKLFAPLARQDNTKTLNAKPASRAPYIPAASRGNTPRIDKTSRRAAAPAKQKSRHDGERKNEEKNEERHTPRR